MKLFAKTLQGFEELLKEELEQFGGQNATIQKRGIAFEGDEETLYRVLINSTLALRILLPIASAKVANEDELYNFVKTSVNWHDHIGLKNTFAFDCVTFHESMNHQVFLAQKSKDAVVDQFRETFDIRPNVDPKNPDVLINLHVSSDGEASLALDASGRSLNQRGYRVEGGDAPLNEILAAGLIKLSGWDPETPFIDPMCGSGTLLIEAAFMAKNKPPGLINGKYGIQNWSWFRKGLWTMKIDEAKSRLRSDVNWIEGSDISNRQIEVAKKNLRKARLTKNVRVRLKPFDAMWIPENKGTIIINLPYGERIGDKEKLAKMYPELGNKLKFKARGYKVCIFTGDPEFKTLFPLQPDKITPLMNGTIPCEFIEYKVHSDGADRPARRSGFKISSDSHRPKKSGEKQRSFTRNKSGRKHTRGEGFTVKQSGGGDLGARRNARPKTKPGKFKPTSDKKSAPGRSSEEYRPKRFSRANPEGTSPSLPGDKKRKNKQRGSGFKFDKTYSNKSKNRNFNKKSSPAIKPIDEGSDNPNQTRRKPGKPSPRKSGKPKD